MLDVNRYSALKPTDGSYYFLIILALVLAGLGFYAAYTMEHLGHQITGMNNHVVWGLPHVFAISLIVTASGTLNGATLASVFGVSAYKPYSRFSVVLSLCCLFGGLMILVLDLGRPDRLVVALTHYNFRSIFTWNIFLYTGFLVICILYLWMMMEKCYQTHVPLVGRVALAWRIILTSGTGCIFGFLVGRNLLDSALLAPLFIALSLVMGTSILAMSLATLFRWQHREHPKMLSQSLVKILVWFLVALAYFSIVQHLTNLYIASHQSDEQFVLTGPLSMVFWIGHVLLGIVCPLALLLLPVFKSPNRLVLASALALAGSGVLVYVIVIGAQSTPQIIFPGYTVIHSRFGDAGFDLYSASLWEWGLGVGGVSVAILLSLLLLRVLPFTPESTTQVNTSE